MYDSIDILSVDQHGALYNRLLEVSVLGNAIGTHSQDLIYSACILYDKSGVERLLLDYPGELLWCQIQVSLHVGHRRDLHLRAIQLLAVGLVLRGLSPAEALGGRRFLLIYDFYWFT